MSEVRSTDISDPTFNAAERLVKLKSKMKLVEKACELASNEIQTYIFEAVTKDITYTAFETRGVPFGRDYFYDRLHKFFYILSELRD